MMKLHQLARLPAAWLIVGAFVLYVVFSLQAIEQPGLEMDSVNPDYLVVRMMNPSSPTDYYDFPGNLLYGRFPILSGTLYAGSYTAYATAPFYALLGGSMLSIRLAHLFLGLLVLLAAGALVREVTRSLAVTGLTLLLLAADPAFFLLLRTQAYITLFPACFALGALYVLHRYRTPRGYLGGGALLGLSAFGYFVYLLMIPGLLWFAMRDSEVAKARAKAVWGLLGGVAVGLFPYVLGYGLIFASTGLQAGAASVHGYLTGLGVGSSQSIGEHVASVLANVWIMLTTQWEWLTFWGFAHVYFGQILKALVLLALPLSVFAFIPRPYVFGRGFALVGLATVSFVIFAMVFGERLGGHDLAAIVPLLYAWAAISAAILLDRFPARRVAGAASAAAIVLLIINAAPALAMTNLLAKHGGTGYFSDIISTYPERVAASGDMTPYVFADWGGMMPFIYLTSGRVPAYDGSEIGDVLCKYGRANLVYIGPDAANPHLSLPGGVRQVATDTLLDPHSGFQYRVVSVRPSRQSCAQAVAAAPRNAGEHGPTALAPRGSATPIPRALILPPGIDRTNLAAIQGVYASGDASLCCGISARAAFPVSVPAGARWLAVSVYDPNFPFVKEQRLTIAVDGKIAMRTAALPEGQITTIDVPLSAMSKARLASVTIVASYSYVPRDEGLNGDTNRYSVTLVRVAVR